MSTRPPQMLPIRQSEEPDSAARLVEGPRYRFDHLTLPMVLKDMRFGRTDPAPGDHVPAFDLPTIGGGRLRSGDLGGRPLLLIFGSSTCPVTDNAAPGLKELHRRFGEHPAGSPKYSLARAGNARMVLPPGILGIWFAVVAGWAWLGVLSLRLGRLAQGD